MRQIVPFILIAAVLAQPIINIEIPSKLGVGINNTIFITYETNQTTDIAVLLPTNFKVIDWDATTRDFEYKERVYMNKNWLVYKWRAEGKGHIKLVVDPVKTGDYEILVITTYFLGFDQKKYEVLAVPPSEIKPVCGNNICEVGEILSCPSDCIRVGKMTAIFITLSIASAIISGVLFYYAREYMKRNLLMYIQLLSKIGGGMKLYEFVKKARLLGLSEDEIRRRLISAGWSPVAVTYALKATRRYSFLWMLKYYLSKVFKR